MKMAHLSASLASNAKLHHSFQATIGYYMAGDPTASFYYNINKADWVVDWAIVIIQI
jgi:hypothetical protein